MGFLFFDISGGERVDEAAGLGNQSRYKGSIVRGFEPHPPDKLLLLSVTRDSCRWRSQSRNGQNAKVPLDVLTNFG